VYAGIVGAISYPLFYVIYNFVNVQGYSNPTIRVVATLLCLFAATMKFWPERFHRFHATYSYGTIFFCLPFFHTFMYLNNPSSVEYAVDGLMAAIFTVLLVDWRNTAVMYVVGSLLGYFCYVLTVGSYDIPVSYLERLPAIIVVLIGGSLFKVSNEQIQEGKMKTAISLAGSIAHEIRNPLSQITASLDGIKEKLPLPGAQSSEAILPKNSVDYLYRMLGRGQDAIERGLQVIDMTLTQVSGKTNKNNSLAIFSAQELTQQAVDSYGYGRKEERQWISMRIDGDFNFKVDQTAYQFVIFNLIKNALYYGYSKSGVTITIHLRPAQQTEKFNQIVIEDNGPGIPADKLEKLFDTFYTSGKSSGTGLGLSFCKRAMNAFGGDIYCESIIEKYTAFILSFPVLSKQEMEQNTKEIFAQSKSLLDGKHILIVDDERLSRRMIKSCLAPFDVMVEEAANGAELLEKLDRDDVIDLIIMDLHMPVMDGYTACQHIRSKKAGIDNGEFIPILAFSAEPSKEAKIKAQKSGFTHFLPKSSSPIRLVEGLVYCLKQEKVFKNAIENIAFKNILIVDDGMINRVVIRSTLEKYGAVVSEAEDGDSALECLQSKKIDLILLDIQMPILNGLELAKMLREEDQYSLYAEIPIIGLSAGNTEVDKNAALDAGMDDYLVKPVSINPLLAKISTYLTNNAENQQPESKLDQSADEKTSDAIHPQFLSNIEAIPVINIETIETIKQYMNPEGLRDMLSSFIESTDDVANRLKTACENNDIAEIGVVTHKFYGISAQIGALRLSKLMREISEQVKHAQSIPLADFLETLDTVVEATNNEFQQQLERVEATSSY